LTNKAKISNSQALDAAGTFVEAGGRFAAIKQHPGNQAMKRSRRGGEGVGEDAVSYVTGIS
jgi:hypothetical protein